MERGFEYMASTGAASAITVDTDTSGKEFGKDLKAQSEKQLQDVLRADIPENSEATKQTTLDAVIKDLGSITRLEFGKASFQQPLHTHEVSQEFGDADNVQQRTHLSYAAPQVALEPLERTMSTASLENLMITEDALEVDSEVGQESHNVLFDSLTRSIATTIPATSTNSETKPVFTALASTESQRLQSLMQEFKHLLEQYQQQTLNLAESYATIADSKAGSNKTDLDLTNLGSVAIQQHDIDGYQSGLAQLTQTLNTMESELEAALRKAEYQELSRQDLEAAHLEMLERLANTSETRCDVPNIATDTKGKHLDRVGELCAKIAQTLGCDKVFVDVIACSARLHDIGKLAIPDSILQKPDRLDVDEYATMKMHTIHGAEMLANNSSEIVQMAQRIALTHHENWDGSGYPYQLEREEIALEGRIAAVADVYDALISSRIYKEAWPKEKAIEQIKSRSGTKFDPVIVEAFLKVIAE